MLVSDLDNVMRRGVVAEDGLEGISFGPQSTGYRHFIYQTLLARLKNEGVLLAAVSRNDPEVALGRSGRGKMVLKEDEEREAKTSSSLNRAGPVASALVLTYRENVPHGE